jgi:arylsulfatase A-like enzyme
MIISGHGSYYQHKSGLVSTPISLVDVAPTTLGLCGIDIPDWMMGTDYSGLRLIGKPVDNPPDSVFIQSIIPTLHSDSIDRPWRGIVTNDRWKYVALEGQPWLMHNLNDDPYEQVNLAYNTKYLKIRKRLQAQLTDWLERTGDEFKLY